MLTIEARRTGSRKKLVPDWQVPLPGFGAGGGSLTLRDLITLVVRDELAAYSERRNERRLTQVLSREAVDQVETTGRLGQERQLAKPPPEEIAIGSALEAFEDGVYLVLLDGEQRLDLDEQVVVSADSKMTFLRLVALAGG